MKMIIALAALVAVALAAPAPQQGKDAVILKSENNVGIENYNYSFETSDGQSASEQGELKNAGSENEAISVRGQFSYVGADGVTYTVTYIADENGFQPQGAHLPQAP